MPGRYASGNVMKRGSVYTLKAAGAETVSTTGGQFETGEAGVLAFIVDVTAASGTSPTMTIVIEGSTEGTTWFTLGTVGANGYAPGSVATAPTNITGVVNVRGGLSATQFIRYRSVIGGTTPSFTYSVTAETN